MISVLEGAHGFKLTKYIKSSIRFDGHKILFNRFWIIAVAFDSSLGPLEFVWKWTWCTWVHALPTTLVEGRYRLFEPFSIATSGIFMNAPRGNSKIEIYCIKLRHEVVRSISRLIKTVNSIRFKGRHILETVPELLLMIPYWGFTSNNL